MIFVRSLLVSFFFFLVFCSPLFAESRSSSGFHYVLKAKKLDFSAQERLGRFLDEAAARLPLKFKEAIARPIRIRFLALDQEQEIHVPCESKKNLRQIYGAVRWPALKPRKFAKTIDLHQAFIPILLQGREAAKTYSCGHHNLYDLALATLIHETAHLYDFSEDPAPDDGENKREGLISGRRTYRQLMGWKNSMTGAFTKNQFLLRSPDPYEFSTISENFAVNIEYFLLDPEYACRRPAAYRYLSQRLEFEPFPDRKCQQNTDVVLSGARFIGSLDASRVYQVHYLFAAKGQQMMSRWGHAMLRLVICAPERTTIDEQCLKDTEHHLVVSFRANINDLMIDTLRGIFGGYPSQLFLYSLNEIIDEYTRKEMRDVISLPLNLTEEEKTQLVKRVAELFWGYSGGYYFISNNCATEAADLLKAVLRDHHPLQETAIFTPRGLFKSLIQLGLADAQVLTDRLEAKKLGFYFPSNRESLLSSFEYLREKGLRDYEQLDDYLNQSDAAVRRKIYTQLQLPKPGKDRRLAAAFFLLESQVRRSLTKWIDDETVASILGLEDQSQKKSGQIDSAISSHQKKHLTPEVLALLKRYESTRFQMNPWFLVQSPSGYGVALSSEVVPVSEIAARQKEFFRLVQEVQLLVKDKLKLENEELTAVKDNILFFSGELRLE